MSLRTPRIALEKSPTTPMIFEDVADALNADRFVL
jgi:hypothetical protein